LTQCVAQNYLDSGQLIAPYWLCAEAHKRKIFPASRTRGGVETAWWRVPDPLGILPLHASAVIANEGALVFLGPSETGKSTMRELLSERFQSLADDAIYLIPQDDGTWHAANADDGWAFRGPLPEKRAVALSSVPLRAVFRLYQSPTPHLEPIENIETSRHLMQAFFEVGRHRKLDVEDKKLALASLAAAARSVPGYRLRFNLSPQTVELVTSTIEEIGVQYDEPKTRIICE
jgi:hypothetical protein